MTSAWPGARRRPRETPRAALDVVLEEIATAVLLVDAEGRVVGANGLAREDLIRDAHGALEAVRESVSSRGTRGRFRVTTVAHTGEPAWYLLVAREARDDAEVRARREAGRMGLTPRETEVALLVARGLSNRSIATVLEVAERTVEAHVTAILEKALVESRAALVARLLE